ncbi:MAG TPA: hypothetical protein VJP79_12625 [Nitrososphaera sp.]|nr:hypothetical protein [Nitrososphaera sp.]
MDTYSAFWETIDYIMRTKPDLPYMRGTCLTASCLTTGLISEAIEQLFRLFKAGIQLVIIAGNQYAPWQKLTDSIFKVMRYFSNIHPILGMNVGKVVIGHSVIHAIPHMYSDEDLRNAMSKLALDPKFKCNIVTAYAAVRGVETASRGEFKEQTIPNRIQSGHSRCCQPIAGS